MTKPHLTKEQGELIANRIKDNDLGESLDDILKDYNLVAKEFVSDEESDESVMQRFSVSSRPQDKSRYDKGMYKVRYMYTASPQPDLIPTSRGFCREVITYQDVKNRVFRKEDIDQMSFRGENSEFGQYSIFRYKGSYGCRHKWQRLIFFRKRNADGTFKPESKTGALENDEITNRVPSGIRPNESVESAARRKNRKP